MTKKLFYYLFIGQLIFACSSADNTSTPTTGTTIEAAKVSGDIEWTYLGTDIAVTNKAPSQGNRSLTLNDDSSISIKLSRNLSGMPFNLEMRIKVNKNDPNSNELYFISDFERPMFKGENYRLITTSVLAPGIAFVNGNTAGYIDWANVQWGIGFGAVAEIYIAETDGLLDNLRTQKFVFSGVLVQDGNQKSSVEVGRFSIQIDGDDMIDTTFF